MLDTQTMRAGVLKVQVVGGCKNLSSTFCHVLFLIKTQTIAVKLDVSITKPNVFLKNPHCFLCG